MSRKKAILILDADRSSEQLAWVTERVGAVHELGEFLWASVTDDQIERLAQQGIVVQVQDTSDVIELPALIFDPSEIEPNPPAALTASPPVAEATAYYLVQFFAPPEPSWVSTLEDLGGLYVQDVPTHGAVMRLTADQATAVRDLAFVSWVGLYHPAYAIHYPLAGQAAPFAADTLRTLQISAIDRVTPETGTVELVGFADTTPESLRSPVEATGATVVMNTGYSLIVSATATQLEAIAHIAGVGAIEPYRAIDLDNRRAGVIIAADQVRNIGPSLAAPNAQNFVVNLTGAGEIVGIIDTGLDGGALPAPMHRDLAGRVLLLANLNGGANPTADSPGRPHGTHVCGSIAGDGTESGGLIRGMAPTCQIVFHAVRQPTVGNPNATNFNNFLQGLVAAHGAGARVHSNSWGTSGVTNNVYTQAESAIIDQFAFFNPDSLVLFSSGNDGQDANNNGILDMNSLSGECVAKNILCIGATENLTATDGVTQPYNLLFPGRYNAAAFNALANSLISDNADEVALFTDRGRVADAPLPAARRRIKPDLVAPGTNIISTGPTAILPFPVGNPRRPNTAPNAFYYVSTGTSMATPIAAGAAVLARQFYRTRFGQLRQPRLLERLEQLIDHPAIARHREGLVIAWVRHDTGTAQNHLVAGLYTRSATHRGETALVRRGAIIQLQANVGAQPVPLLARHGDRTLLLHRASDNTLRLSCYDAALAPVATFGTNGVVTLAPASRTEATRHPALWVQGDEMAVVWHPTGTDTLVFQRFRTDTGAAIGAVQMLGAAIATSSQPYLAHTGFAYGVVWVHREGSDYKLQMRLVDASGTPVGTQPQTLLTQAQEIRDPALTDTIGAGFLITWVTVTGTPTGDEIQRLEVDHTLAATGAIATITPAPTPIPGGPVPLPPKGIRRVWVAPHPELFHGYVLGWEDDTQLVHDNLGNWQSRYDVYLAFLDLNGNLNGQISGDRLRLSDTPESTHGFAGRSEGEGCFVSWLSPDEGNADFLGAYALAITAQGAFQAQREPLTPLLDSGRYVRHLWHRQADLSQTATAIAWAGGHYFLLRAVSDGMVSRLHLVHTNADGLVDETLGGSGFRELNTDIAHEQVTLYWAGSHLSVAHAFGISTYVFLLDTTGALVTTFGTQGVREIREPVAPTISPQVSHSGSGASLQVMLTYGRFDGPQSTLRYAVYDRRGNAVVRPRNLVSTVTGTARQGWFYDVPSESPRRAIAAWHVRDGATLTVQINRFHPNGQAQRRTPVQLTGLPGDSLHAVIAPRPVLVGLEFPAAPNAATRRRQREYGIAWEYHPAPVNPADPPPPFEIRFSRLNRNGTVGAIQDIAVVAKATHHATHPQLIWHTNGYGLAWLEQPIGGGAHTLCFTILDADGARVNLAAFGAPAAPAPDYVLSETGSDVKQFHLVWNGRSFRVSWTEERANELRHLQQAIAVPRQAGSVGYDQPYHHPTSALIRATLINGATNLRQTALPNLSNDPRDGYGWGRINLRQSLAPSPPVTLFARDDNAVASGHIVRYEFYLPPNTRRLRATLTWTDPPGNRLVNNLNLRLTVPATAIAPSQVYVGNRWQAATPQFSDPLPAVAPANPFDSVYNAEQIIIPDPPEGIYQLEVIGGRFSSSQFQQFPGQPFAVVCIGSGEEVPFTVMPPPANLPFY